MKRTPYLLLGAIAGIAGGTLLAVPFNHWYMANHVRSDDDSNFLVGLLLFWVWPISIVIGGAIGNFVYRHNLFSRTPGLPKDLR